MSTVGNGACVDFQRYPHTTDLGMEFTLGWFRFKAFERENILPYVHNIDVDQYGWAFNPKGIQITPTVPMSKVTIKGASFVPPDLELKAVSTTGATAVETIPGNQGMMTKTLSVDRIDHILVTNESYEGFLSTICADDVDLHSLIDHTIEEAMNDEKLKDLLNDPLAVEIIRQAYDDLADYMDGTKEYSPPQSPSGNGGESDGEGGILDQFQALKWPPDWCCVVKNLALMLAAMVAVQKLAAALGAQPIGPADLIKALAGLFPEAIAPYVGNGLLGVGAVAMAIWYCRNSAQAGEGGWYCGA